MKNLDRRNKYFFGLGTIGRDMFYAFEANALLYFLSNILSLRMHVFAAVSLVLSVLRIADALNDPITGLVIDNIHTKWGKFKPAILVGGVVSVIFLSNSVRQCRHRHGLCHFLCGRVRPLGYQLRHQ